MDKKTLEVMMACLLAVVCGAVIYMAFVGLFLTVEKGFNHWRLEAAKTDVQIRQVQQSCKRP